MILTLPLIHCQICGDANQGDGNPQPVGLTGQDVPHKPAGVRVRDLSMRLLVAVGILTALLAATVAEADVIRFGAILPLTGSAARTGLQQMHGIQFAVDRVNGGGGIRGNTIEVLFKDDHADPARSVTAFDELVNGQKVPVILIASVDRSLALAPLATDRRILLVNADAQDDRLATASPYLINTLPPMRDEVKALSRYLVSMNKKRGVVLFEDSHAGDAGRADFERHFSEAGGTVLAVEPARTGQLDYRPSLQKLAYAAPEVALISVFDGLRRIAHQYKTLGLEFTLAAPGSITADMIADPSFGGLIYTQVHADTAPQLADAFKTRFEMAMTFPVRQYYDAAQVVLTVTDRLLAEDGKLTGENMRAMLFAIRKFDGLTPLTFTTNTATLPLEIRTVHDGQAVTLERVTVEP